MNNKIITEINRIKEIILLNENVSPAVMVTRRWLLSGFEKLGGTKFLDEFDSIFRSNPETKNTLGRLKNELQSFGDDAIKTMTNDEIELLLRARDPEAFARFVIRSTKIGESMDTLFTQVDNLVLSGRRVDVDRLVADLKAQIDDIEGIGNVPQLKENMYRQIDESAEAASRGTYNLERGLTSDVDLDVLLSAIFKDSKVRGRLLANNKFKLELRTFIRENIGKTGDEIAEALQKSIDNHINSLKINKDKFLEFIARREKNASTNPAVLRELKNLKDIVLGKYGYSVRRGEGYGIGMSLLKGPGKALLHAWLIDFAIGNIIKWLTGRYDDPEEDIYFSFVPTLISLMIKGGEDLAKEVKKELTSITKEEAEEWAKKQDHLSNLIDDPKNHYIFIKEDPNQSYVNMINYGDDPNKDPDFLILKSVNTIHYREDNPKDRQNIIDTFLETLNLND